MQLTMWPLAAAIFVVGLLFPVHAGSASLVVKGTSSEGVSVWRKSNTTVRTRRLRRGRQDPTENTGTTDSESGDNKPAETLEDRLNPDTAVTDAQSTKIPCSCDCCQVQKMLPLDFVPTQEGAEITSVCFKAAAESSQSTVCGDQCQPEDDNEILSSSLGELDYNRFCNYNCRPVTDAPGTACVQFDKDNYDQAKSDPTGNGVELYPTPVLGIGSGFKDPEKDDSGSIVAPDGDASTAVEGEAGTATGKQTAEADNAAKKKAADADAEKVKIVYDLRKLVAERLRSEASANVASAAAAAERVRINRWQAKKNLEVITKMREESAAVGGSVEEGVAGVEESKTLADEAEKATQKDLAESQQKAVKLAKDVKKLADAAIKKEAEPCVKLAAEMKAQAKGLDKPDDWFKVVAARAANPYQVAVTAAVQRTAEYKGLADSLMNQAYAAQKKANSLIPHVNVLEAQGDVIGATIEKKDVTNLLSKARALQKEAAGYWDTAQKTRLTIPKWQNAAAQAAAYAAWEYKNNAKAFR